MFWPVLIVAVGLLIALAGMLITFIICPPVYGSCDDAGDFDVNRNREIRRVHRSKVGFWLLASGTFSQLIGTVWQPIRMAFDR